MKEIKIFKDTKTVAVFTGLYKREFCDGELEAIERSLDVLRYWGIIKEWQIMETGEFALWFDFDVLFSLKGSVHDSDFEITGPNKVVDKFAEKVLNKLLENSSTISKEGL